MTHEHDDWADGDCTACLNERTVSYWAGLVVQVPNPNVARIPTPDQRTLRRWGIMLGFVKDPGLYGADHSADTYEEAAEQLRSGIYGGNRPTDKACAWCGREEPNGTWYVPCPSDDCPSHKEER